MWIQWKSTITTASNLTERGHEKSDIIQVPGRLRCPNCLKIGQYSQQVFCCLLVNVSSHKYRKLICVLVMLTSIVPVIVSCGGTWVLLCQLEICHHWHKGVSRKWVRF